MKRVFTCLCGHACGPQTSSARSDFTYSTFLAHKPRDLQIREIKYEAGSPPPTTDKLKMVWRINACSMNHHTTLNKKTWSICFKNLDSGSLALRRRRVLVKVTYQPPTPNKTTIQSSSVFCRPFPWRFTIIHMQRERVSNSSQKTEWPMADIM